ncbi:hypothetical protein MHYP_G00108030 [Metynnis hypsauchen]
MDPAVIIILLLYRIDFSQAVRNSEPLVISTEPGEAVTLNCTFVDDSNKDVRMWYKQRLEHAPLEVGSKFEAKPAVISDKFDKSRFKLNRTASGISLRIERVTKEDEGMYFCGETGKNTLDFSTATFLAVTEYLVDPVMLAMAVFSAVCVAVICAQTILIHKLRKSEHRAGEKVQQEAMNERTTRQEQNPENLHYTAIHIKEKKAKDPAQAVDLSEASFVSAESGENVTLHCKFVEKSGQSVKSWVWYKQRAGQEPQEVAVKLPEKRAATSSDRFKISQSFDLTIEQTNKDDEGMYFCGVGVRNTITFSKGTFLAVTEGPVDPTVFYLGAALGICVIVICIQAIQNCRVRDHDSVVENKASQDSAAVELNYAAKSLRMKSGRSGHSVYSELRYFSVTDPNNH